ncbi:molybdopterin-dependent oxidoreductase [Mesorhizobium sp. RP14(2022)]|uniref:Molybdopterin-dependent oxidoreductase n=1 Tax=Mesorhizobium liriopis TaxID=2953882 RepID=A0ABT1C899_9HYPH|nr:molybdopterin-dependent oxidoreductase [Mesorhizobium liriopis]MCO6051007.1 molybdopterin-dependent oxidoreductase [Mesorhizobium liriopis]
MPFRLLALTSAIALGLASLSAPASGGAPILVLGGTAAKPAQALDLAGLDAMPQTSFETNTPWHKGPVTFSGVLLKDYLATLGAHGTRVQLIALNDYTVEAPVDELVEGGALLATRQNGQPMPVSEKGPVFLLFPFDSRKELQHQTYYSRSVWQLSEIDILE